jgi:uncharacterized protein
LSRVIVVWAKAPIPGLVKTRLCPPLSHEQAAGLQQAMTADKVRQALGVGDAAVHVACYPPEAMESMLLPEEARRIPQQGDNLDERLCNCLTAMWQLGHRHVIFSDSDSPTLPGEAFADAFRALENGSDVCICPSDDGGYCFIALAAPRMEMFTDISWSTNLVLARTVAIAEELGLRTSLAPAGFDVDDVHGLAQLTRALEDPAARSIAPETLRWMRADSQLG